MKTQDKAPIHLGALAALWLRISQMPVAKSTERGI